MSVVLNGKTLLTYSDFVHFPEDGQRHELIGGEHYVTPSPNTRHQRISIALEVQLYRQIKEAGLGEVFDAPMDLVLSPSDVVEPDLIVVLNSNRRIITPKNIQGAPDLVVEITSPSTEKRDRELKLSLYQAHAVPEYWIVRCDQDCVDQHLLENGVYRLVGTFRDALTFHGLDGVTVDLAKVW